MGVLNLVGNIKYASGVGSGGECKCNSTVEESTLSGRAVLMHPFLLTLCSRRMFAIAEQQGGSDELKLESFTSRALAGVHLLKSPSLSRFPWGVCAWWEPLAMTEGLESRRAWTTP